MTSSGCCQHCASECLSQLAQSQLADLINPGPYRKMPVGCWATVGPGAVCTVQTIHLGGGGRSVTDANKEGPVCYSDRVAGLLEGLAIFLRKCVWVVLEPSLGPHT